MNSLCLHFLKSTPNWHEDCVIFKEMNVGLYQSVSGIKANMAAQERIAADLAMLNISGHKRMISAFEVAPRADLKEGQEAQGKNPKTHLNALPLRQVNYFDFSQGPIISSTDPLHVAISGEGFFRVKEKDGSISLTREGNFVRQADGKVTTQDGAEVLVDGGQPLALNRKEGLVISNNGAIAQKIVQDAEITFQPVGRFSMASVDEPQKNLELNPQGRFIAKGNAVVREEFPQESGIAQNSLEMSNTSAADQMVNMIEVFRAYEANNRMVRAQDEATGNLIRGVRG